MAAPSVYTVIGFHFTVHCMASQCMAFGTVYQYVVVTQCVWGAVLCTGYNGQEEYCRKLYYIKGNSCCCYSLAPTASSVKCSVEIQTGRC